MLWAICIHIPTAEDPILGVTKEALRDWHLAIIPLAVVSGIPPGDIHHDGYHAGTIMAYGVRHMPHGMYSIWYYGYMHIMAYPQYHAHSVMAHMGPHSGP